MARRGLDHMSAWILAIVASGALFGTGYGIVRLLGSRASHAPSNHGDEHGGGHGEQPGGGHGEKPAAGHGSDHGEKAAEHGGKDDAHGSGKADEHGGGHEKAGEHGEPAKSHAAPAHGESHGAASPHWEYKGSAGPEHWSDLSPSFAVCSAGKTQSPIDIDAPNNNAKLLPIRLTYKPTEVSIQNNGHTIQVDFPIGNYMELEGERFDLVQFHFHAPSEHKVAGIPYDFELHLVHKNAEGRLAVVGVLFEEGGAQKALEPILASMPREKAVSPDRLTVDVNNLLPKKRTYYTYAGSLTTPPCSEGVRWLVLSQPNEVSAKQVDSFVANVSFNARPVQPIKSRTVMKSTR